MIIWILDESPVPAVETSDFTLVTDGAVVSLGVVKVDVDDIV